MKNGCFQTRETFQRRNHLPLTTGRALLKVFHERLQVKSQSYSRKYSRKCLRCPLAREAVICHLQAFHSVHFRNLEEASFHTVSSLSLHHLIYCIKISLYNWQLRAAAYHSGHAVQGLDFTFLVPFVSSIQLFSVLP